MHFAHGNEHLCAAVLCLERQRVLVGTGQSQTYRLVGLHRNRSEKDVVGIERSVHTHVVESEDKDVVRALRHAFLAGELALVCDGDDFGIAYDVARLIPGSVGRALVERLFRSGQDDVVVAIARGEFAGNLVGGGSKFQVAAGRGGRGAWLGSHEGIDLPVLGILVTIVRDAVVSRRDDAAVP